MEPELRRKIEDNLFGFARGAVEPWDAFPWHLDGNGRCDAWKCQSSQALAIDVFGALKQLAQFDRDAVLASMARQLRIPHGGPWVIELEWSDPTNRLREPRKSQLDVLARSPEVVICFECKFSEENGGACSQVNKVRAGAHRGIRQCDGNYAVQSNPVNRIQSRCALAGKGIRYWDFIPVVLRLRAEGTYSPCPFAGPWYQWMRNIVLAHAIGTSETRRAAVVIVYADSPELAFPQYLKTKDWRKFRRKVRRDVIPVALRSYQSIIASTKTGLSIAGTEVWADLARWVEAKIQRVTSGV